MKQIIFVSYSRADIMYLKKVLEVIHLSYGYGSVWYDNQIKGGDNWWEVIKENIRNCKVFIFLISNDSLASNYCYKECKYAIKLEKPIIPILLRPKTELWGEFDKELVAYFKKTHYLDLSEMNAETIARLLGAISENLQNNISITKQVSVIEQNLGYHNPHDYDTPNKNQLDKNATKELELLLANYEDSLRIINNRISEFVSPTNVPLQLIRDKNKIEQIIVDIQNELEGD